MTAKKPLPSHWLKEDGSHPNQHRYRTRVPAEPCEAQPCETTPSHVILALNRESWKFYGLAFDSEQAERMRLAAQRLFGEAKVYGCLENGPCLVA